MSGGNAAAIQSESKRGAQIEMNRFFHKATSALALAAIAATAVSVGACAPKHKPLFIESGFLTEYAMLHPGEPGQLAMVYRNPNADFSTYHKILFEPLTIWIDETQSSEMHSDDLQKIANGLYYAVALELRKEWQLVTESGPGVMRLRIGLIAVDHPEDHLDVYTTVAAEETANSDEPIPASLRGIGEHITVEVELFDDQTREVLAAAVDRWADTGPHGPVETWADVHREFENWGRWLRGRLHRGAAAGSKEEL